MITPRFEVSQDDDFVKISIRAPYIKASNITFEVAGDTFVFSLPPYFLRLRFPHNLVEDERMTSNYDIARSTVHCSIAKENPGEYFEDLDMLSKLLSRREPPKKALVEEDMSEAQPDEDEDDEDDWEIDQHLPETDPIKKYHYGFNNQYSEFIGVSLHSANEINLLPDPEHTANTERREILHKKAIDDFDQEHYLADLWEPDMIHELLRYEPDTKVELSPEESDLVIKLPKRRHIIDNPKPVYLGLVPLLFGCAYDERSNTGDITVESSWNVGRLASNMSFLFNDYYRVTEVVEDCTLLSLTYPLYRSWDLTMRVWQDVIQALQSRKHVLKRLLRLLVAFESELHFCYRQILLEDYAVWIQYASDRVLSTVRSELIKALKSLDKSSFSEIDLISLDKADPAQFAQSNDTPDSDDESE